MTEIIATERLSICAWELDDADTLAKLSWNPGLGEYGIQKYANLSTDEARAWIEKQIASYDAVGTCRFAIVLKKTGQLIGISGMYVRSPKIDDGLDINWRYPIAFRGKGYAFEAAECLIGFAFDMLEKPHVNAFISPDNEPSKALAEKLGFKFVRMAEELNRPAELWQITSDERIDTLDLSVDDDFADDED
ncbi:MAG: GNAT family N-acetyltransferase [Bdellovibrionota bacterium]